MFCPRCGREIRAESRFCAYCGAPIASVSQPEPSIQHSPSEGYAPPQQVPAAPVTTAAPGTDAYPQAAPPVASPPLYPQAAPPMPGPEAYRQTTHATAGPQAYGREAQVTPEQKRSAILWLLVIIGVIVISVIVLIVLFLIAKGGGKSSGQAAKPAVEASAETGSKEMEADAETGTNTAGEEEQQVAKGALDETRTEKVVLPVDSEEEAVALVMRDPYVRDWYANSPNAQVEASDEGDHYMVHVFQVVQNDPSGGHAATYGWYTVDKLTGEVTDMLR